MNLLRHVLAFPFTLIALFCLLVVFMLANPPRGITFEVWLLDELDSRRQRNKNWI